jgi:hypothetical protein
LCFPLDALVVQVGCAEVRFRWIFIELPHVVGWANINLRPAEVFVEKLEYFQIHRSEHIITIKLRM